MSLITREQKDLNDQLFVAAARGRYKEVDSLLDKDAQIHAVDHWQSTPLHLAAMCGGIDAVKLLLSKGARLDLKDYFDRTPEAAAESCNQSPAADMLKERLLLAGALWEDCRKPGGTVQLMTPDEFAMICNLGRGEAILALEGWKGHADHATTLIAPLAKDVRDALKPAHAVLLGADTAAEHSGWRRLPRT